MLLWSLVNIGLECRSLEFTAFAFGACQSFLGFGTIGYVHTYVQRHMHTACMHAKSSIKYINWRLHTRIP